MHFTGTKVFSFKTPSLKWINGKKSYMGMRVRVTQTADALVNGSPVILPCLRPVTATNILSRVDRQNHPGYVTLPNINTQVQPVSATITNLNMATNSTQPNATSTATLTYTTVPSNISNVIDYFPDYDIKS